MTREKKVEKKKLRAYNRAKRRRESYFKKIKIVQELGYDVPLSVCDKYGVCEVWSDSSSPTGLSQKCTMGGKCQAPCNGDC